MILSVKNMSKKNNYQKNNKNDSNKNDNEKNIYGAEKGIPELILSDFTYKKNELFVKGFPENKGLIVFYAPWCVHCKKLSDLMFDLAYSYMNVFTIYAVNCENVDKGNDKLCQYAEIEKYPTIKYITPDGMLKDYTNHTNPDDLIFFINSQL